VRCSSWRGPSQTTTLSDFRANVDAYGTYARHSALADYGEVVAWRQGSFAEATLADLIRDNAWVRRLGDLMRLPDDQVEEEAVEAAAEEDGGGMDDEPWGAAASEVFDLLRDRADTLGDSYPFTVTEVLERREPTGTHAELYLALLALTVSHAYDVACGDLNPRQVFEESVEASLSAKGLLATNMGRAGRESGQFDDAVMAAGEAVGLRPTPGAATRRVYANDEKVDALAHLRWDDDRAACWTFIGQATCAASDEWPRKLAEVAPNIWRDYLGIQTFPLPFLAVPHHVGRPMFDYLVRQEARMVLDRLRLCQRDTLLDAERQLLDCLNGLEIAIT
jgi:hypothetical protein